MIPNVVPEGNRFLYMWELGFRRLCPVIPPGAPLSDKSWMHKRLLKGDDARGKAPGRRNPGTGLWSGFDWTKHEATEADLAAWHEMGASTGVKLGRGLVAVDIDTLDKTTAKDLYLLAQDMLGQGAPLRFGRKPKALLLYRVAGDVPYDQVAFSTPTEDKALVEILTEGRQFVAFGTHPVTGKPYDWEIGPLPFEDLPETTPHALEAYLAEVERRMPAAKRFTGSIEDRSTIDQAGLRGELDLLRSALNALPNPDDVFPSREDWLRMGYAIKAGFGAEHEDEALERFQQWTQRWDKGTSDPDYVEAEWQRMHPPFAIGANYVMERAVGLAGWSGRAEAFFGDANADLLPGGAGAAGAGAGQEAKPARRYEILRIKDILCLPKPRWLVDRHLPEDSSGFLYGRPGCGKSFMALDWALHVAYGLPTWHGDAVRPRPGGNVLYLAREGARGFGGRALAWQKAHGLDGVDGLADRFALIRQTINFTKPEDIHALLATVEHESLAPLDLIVVDTVSRAVAGADENLQKEMTLFVAACEALQNRHQCAVLGVHHAGKNGDMRGSTVLEGMGDFIFRLTRQEGNTLGQLYCQKMKDAEDDWSETYAFGQHGVVFADGSEGTSLVPRRVVEGDEEVADNRDDDQRFLDAVRAAWDTGKPWSPAWNTDRSITRLAPNALGLRLRVVQDMVARHLALGHIEVAQCAHKVRGYRVIKAPSIFD